MTVAPRCASCSAPLSGRFCSHCGAPADSGNCPGCGSALSPGARFCHRCGTAARGDRSNRRDRRAWIVAGAAVVLSLLAVVWRTGAFRPTVPDMGNAGNVDTREVPGPAGRAPDISAMSPRQRFDRLFDRVMSAAQTGDSNTVLRFAPMALGAYALLDSVDADARYHAAMIALTVGAVPEALALSDTLLAQAPGHLFGYIIRGEAAERRNDATALTRSYREFLDHYEAEMRTGRIEYQEHQPILDDFRTRARASLAR